MREIAFVLYEGCTPLDLVGPLQVFGGLARLDPDNYRTIVVGEGAVSSDTVLGLVPSHSYAEAGRPYGVVVPGGLLSTLKLLADQEFLGRISGLAENAELIGSVCTGSLLLGAAGLLDGHKATTHWMFRDLLAKFGATPVAERWVGDGRISTAAGVAAGIDWALYVVQQLAGEEMAREIQLLLEYDPEPPLGRIDWTQVDLAARKPVADGFLAQALADHPELLAELSA